MIDKDTSNVQLSPGYYWKNGRLLCDTRQYYESVYKRREVERHNRGLSRIQKFAILTFLLLLASFVGIIGCGTLGGVDVLATFLGLLACVAMYLDGPVPPHGIGGLY